MRKRLQSRSRTAVRVSDVADRAGCSTATVSRALNTPALVSRAVRDRVGAAIRDLGYVPNSAARALRAQRTRIIGTVIPTLRHAIYARMVDALQRVLGQHGYSLLVTTSEFDLEQDFEQARLLVERGIDGLVLVGDLHDPRLYELLRDRKLPFVNTYTYRPDTDHPSVGFDNRLATARIADLLVDLGHRDIAMIAGIRRDNDRAIERVEGVAQALAARGLMLRDEHVVEEPYTLEGGRQGLRRVLGSGSRVTALICGSDVIAFGVMVECETLGIAVPGGLSIVGFDNLDFAGYLKPPLTTLEVPAPEMGQRAGEYLMARLRGSAPSDHFPLETNLILRRTTAPPPSVARRSPLPSSDITKAAIYGQSTPSELALQRETKASSKTSTQTSSRP
jgi:LacI family transcriptional regulator